MKAMLSATSSKDKGLKFYRMMGLIGMGISIFYAWVFVFLFDEGVELIWDRVVMFASSAVVYALSFSRRFPIKRLYHISNVNFYLFTTQVVVAACLNSFEFTYLVAVIVAIQAISISFRTSEQAGRYLIYTTLLNGMGLLMNPSAQENSLFIFLTLVTTSLLIWITVRLKVKFQQTFKVHEELLRTIVSKTENTLFLTDFEGDIYDTNVECEDMFGYTRDELVGKNFSYLRTHVLTEEEDLKGVQQMLQDKFWNSEIELTKKDGSSFMAYVSVGWIQKFGNEYLVYRVKDISAEKEFERQIIEAKEKAEEAVRTKSQFLATMSHEIRTPMNGVIGMTSMLSRTKLNAQQTNYVDTIKKSGENLLVIINDILDFSKIESGKIELDNHLFDLHEMLVDILDLLGPIAEAKNLNMALKIAKDVPKEVVADSTRLKQVLINLINNAIKFTPEGNVRILVEKAADNKVLFKVVDTGIGIPQHKIETLFDSFTQVDSSTTRKYGGTGLGLSICKELVHIMGGEIFVTSSESDGSTFAFTIGVTELVEDTSQTIDQSLLLDQQLEALDLADKKVLIAEDNVVNQQVALMMLTGMGVNADVVENGALAFAKCQEKEYDLVFMDIQMPEMDGIEATAKINTLPAENRPYIIALTANAMEADKRRCGEVGMDGFLSKPIILDSLKQELLNAFTNENLPQQSDQAT